MKPEKAENKTKKNKGNEQKIVINTASIQPSLSIITINMNDLNLPIKRQRLSEWIKKKNPKYMLSIRMLFKYKDTHRVKVKG